ncbi:HD domain-containing protein [Ilumatobacter nonamiensis]|uniref:HD domain-containing protein n=1 Tax=Ilumatobacter nonamiensis TaxID=467093 RepID=UPI00034D68FA|nr:hypothetical protein [Ilumatobacter nonamiensis]
MSSPLDPVDDTPTSRLPVRWRRHVSDDTTLLDRLVARHREKHRRYHTVAHVAAVVGWVDDLATVEPTLDLDATIAAAFYHDAVYEPTSPANEHASARLARRDLASLGWADERTAHVAALIEATRDHRSPPDTDHAVLFDADLSVLGATPTEYDGYVEAVRAEYREVDDDAWKVGRRRVLEAFLERASIYATATGRERWESSARANLAREIDSLTS